MSHITNPEGAAPASSSNPPLFNARRVRVQHIARAKAEGIPLTMLTAYDALTAPILEAAGVDMLLIGDSLGNVILGHSSTLPVTLEDMERATAAVARSTSRVMIVADLPFGTYEDSPEHAFASATRLMKAGAHAVKLEGGEARAHIIAALTAAGIPVCAHLGYTPQSENTLGGPRMQGRGDGADQLRRDSLAVQEAGAFAVVFEMVPAAIATELTQTLSIATIGIGAGPNTDGQVLVWSDMAGYSDWTPSFVHKFGQLGQALHEAASDYVGSVRERSFPGPENYKND
ncbi:3-methyl-2-oxobutanoate hydroxymethyltransferase [uncultured Actinomyces sp.]|uniref:3-methyl-2-oxobutanoate hydroxymethyltransferase n=1 Tax=uncultured Actinomyces sp. TaxID=249061 RepID=UPI0025F6A3A4|nr:3-methyl-2-oxobutanoate hydroxymethyltransferase [uncultured Actinomyces sp.]